jgi:hypothetical protein
VSFKQSLDQAISEEMRLRILQQLENQVDGQLSIVLMKRVIDSYGFRRDRDWIETQLRKLEALGAVSLSQPGGILIARIERPGLDHVEERSVLAGVTRPRDAE